MSVTLALRKLKDAIDELKRMPESDQRNVVIVLLGEVVSEILETWGKEDEHKA